MKTILSASLMAALAFSCAVAAAQDKAGSTANTGASAGVKAKAKRSPVFRASKEQIKQAQAMLKQRGYYSGTETGKLNDDTRAGLKKFQEAESIKATGTLNRATLEKMNIALSDKQRMM
ncbi:MAG TPA: peptidoglycan-binding domain-containing protein [Pyrinomonadaceae bacterium]|jgi:peptidoglycan hydrolase-like protein with peptidoglycan-binding domain|nr:peptidoglycan-binding domain-containing protein [Pyrinomonadaceae bacterium]